MPSSGPAELGLPGVGHPARPRERADARRNRRKILDAAATLFGTHGVDQVSLDAVAAEAGVGKGTLFRRFGDKAGLAAALLDEQESAVQQAILSGPPPIGPGAPPAQRAAAFTRRYLDYVLDNTDLVLMSETASPGARFRLGAFRFWHRHLVVLLEQGGVATASEASVLAHAVLAPLGAEQLVAQLAGGIDRDRLVDGLVRHTGAVFGHTGAVCDCRQR